MDSKLSDRRDRAKRRFYRHLARYLIFSVFFVVLNLATSPGNWWFFWPIFGWGIAIANHAFRAFGSDAYAEAEADHERRTKRYSRRLRPHNDIDHQEELHLDERKTTRVKQRTFSERDLV